MTAKLQVGSGLMTTTLQARVGVGPPVVGWLASLVVAGFTAIAIRKMVNTEMIPAEPMSKPSPFSQLEFASGLQNLRAGPDCNGSLKYAHRKCVQHWCNEKGDIICEICHQSYQPGYTAPGPNPEETTIDIGGGWQLSGMPLDLHHPRLLAIAEAERQLLEAEYDDYHATNAGGAAFCRSAALILMALLLLRHALTITDTDGDDGEDDPSAFFSLFLLRVAGFILPCYIMVWAIGLLQKRKQRQEAAALAATQFAFLVQSELNRGVHFAIASAAPVPVPVPVPVPATALPPQLEQV